MKNKDIVSAVVGSCFFAVPYLALSVPLLPSLAIAGASVVAGELLFSDVIRKSYEEVDLETSIKMARADNKHIRSMIKMIDNTSVQVNLKDICDNINKIINTIEKNPKKVKKVSKE